MIAMLGYAVRADVPQVPTGTWAAGGQFGDIPRDVASAVLPDGRLLVTGGSSADGQPLGIITAYDPASGTWSSPTQLTEPRAGHTATVLADGRVLITGGRTANGLTASVETYDPATGTSTTTGVLSVARADHAAARLADGRVLIVGGSDGAEVLATAEIFDPATGFISQLPASLLTPRAKHSATALLDGHVLVAGGNDGSQDLASAEIFDAETGSFAVTAPLNAPRSGHTAILLPHNNEVLIAGGTSNGNTLASVERFSDWNGAFLPDANTMTAARSGGVGVPTPRDGVVLVAGGGSAQSELYGFATLKTDKDDYAPGEIVTFTGSGWQPGETVKLTVSEDADTHDDFVFEAVADEFGNIVNTEFYPREDEVYHHLGARFYATARGIASEALITFTDAGTLTINFAGDGSGSVVGNGAGNNQPSLFSGCTSSNGSCSIIYTSNGTVVLTATAAPDSTFTGWSSNVDYDSATNTYSIRMNQSKTITVTFTRTSQNQTIAFGPLGNKTYGDADFNVSATASSGLPVSFSATGSCSISGNTVHITAAGGCTITANQAGNGQYNPAPAVQQSFTIAQATPVVTVTGGTSKYDGAAHAASATAKFNGADVNGTFSFTYNGSSQAPVNVGSYAVIASFTSTDTNFKNATGNGNITITKADAVVVVNGTTVTYDGLQHGATGTATGVTGEDLGSLLDLGTKFTNAPGGTANWTFAGNDNYNSKSGSVAITINKANASVTVNGATVTYDGYEHGATGTATGVTGESLTSLLDLGAKFTDVPGGTASWSFAGNGNYNATSGSVAIVIEKANATVHVEGVTVTYDGHEHGATGTATGVGGQDLSSSLNLGEPFTNVPGGTAHWTFTGGTNYENASGSVEIKIDKATPVVSVPGGTHTYDGQPHPATATAAGVSGSVAGTFSFTYNGSASEPLNAGTYAVVATFASTDGNYDNATGAGTITINKANAVIVVEGGTYTYNGTERGAHGTATGVADADLSSSLNLGEKFTDAPGGIANWTFTGGTNYENASGSVEIKINKATPVVNVTGGAYTYDGQSHPAAATVTGVGGSSVAGTFNFTYNGSASEPVNAGTYAVVATFTSTDGNYTNATGVGTITINKAPQTINVTRPAPSNALYNTSFTVEAVGGGSGNPVTFSAGGTCSVAGATFTMTSGYGQCTVTLNQAGNNNYQDAVAVVETVNATAWQIGGFYSPVTPSTPANPIWNVVKGGSTVPLKFEIFAGANGAEQTSLSAIKSMWLQPVSCTAGTAVSVETQLDNTGGTSLRYDGSQFIQNWKTPTGAGCFVVTMTAADNTAINAYFRIK
jgi:hypothetical protein